MTWLSAKAEIGIIMRRKERGVPRADYGDIVVVSRGS